MKIISDMKRICFIALNTGKISPKRKCLKCGKVEDVS